MTWDDEFWYSKEPQSKNNNWELMTNNAGHQNITFKSDKHENMIFSRHSRRISRQIYFTNHMTKPLMEER